MFSILGTRGRGSHVVCDSLRGVPSQVQNTHLLPLSQWVCSFLFHKFALLLTGVDRVAISGYTVNLSVLIKEQSHNILLKKELFI